MLALCCLTFFLSSIVLKPSTSNIAQGTTDPVIAGTATEITLWDKLSLFDTGGWLSPTFGSSGTPVSYTKGNIAMRTPLLAAFCKRIKPNKCNE